MVIVYWTVIKIVGWDQSDMTGQVSMTFPCDDSIPGYREAIFQDTTHSFLAPADPTL